MDNQPDPHSRNFLPVLLIALILLVLVSGLAGWLIGRRNDNNDNSEVNDTSQAAPPTSSGRVTDLVEFDVPGGWDQESCEGHEDVVYFVPSDQAPDCSNEPQESITLAVDPQNNTDCNQLQDVQDVSKHVCRSIFIDGHKTLEATTVYNQDSDVLPNRTIDAYYLDTGEGVVVARYIHDGNAEHGTVFHDLAKGLRVRD